jgi:hypothetical protein
VAEFLKNSEPIIRLIRPNFIVLKFFCSFRFSAEFSYFLMIFSKYNRISGIFSSNFVTLVWDPYSTNWFLRTHARLDEAAVLAGLPCALLLWSAVPGRSQVHRRPRAAVDKRGGCAMVAGGFVVYAVVCCM